MRTLIRLLIGSICLLILLPYAAQAAKFQDETDLTLINVNKELRGEKEEFESITKHTVGKPAFISDVLFPITWMSVDLNDKILEEKLEESQAFYLSKGMTKKLATELKKKPAVLPNGSTDIHVSLGAYASVAHSPLLLNDKEFRGLYFMPIVPSLGSKLDAWKDTFIVFCESPLGKRANEQSKITMNTNLDERFDLLTQLTTGPSFGGDRYVSGIYDTRVSSGSLAGIAARQYELTFESAGKKTKLKGLYAYYGNTLICAEMITYDNNYAQSNAIFEKMVSSLKLNESAGNITGSENNKNNVTSKTKKMTTSKLKAEQRKELRCKKTKGCTMK